MWPARTCALTSSRASGIHHPRDPSVEQPVEQLADLVLAPPGPVRDGDLHQLRDVRAVDGHLDAREQRPRDLAGATSRTGGSGPRRTPAPSSPRSASRRSRRTLRSSAPPAPARSRRAVRRRRSCLARSQRQRASRDPLERALRSRRGTTRRARPLLGAPGLEQAAVVARASTPSRTARGRSTRCSRACAAAGTGGRRRGTRRECGLVDRASAGSWAASRSATTRYASRNDDSTRGASNRWPVLRARDRGARLAPRAAPNPGRSAPAQSRSSRSKSRLRAKKNSNLSTSRIRSASSQPSLDRRFRRELVDVDEHELGDRTVDEEMDDELR